MALARGYAMARHRLALVQNESPLFLQDWGFIFNDFINIYRLYSTRLGADSTPMTKKESFCHNQFQISLTNLMLKIFIRA